ncbi:MAG: ParB/RepB/Spo0J family partition protein [Acidimicrobiia bacterium]
MAERRTGLGRGIGALIPPAVSAAAGLQTIPLDRIATNPRQPRSYFDDEAMGTLAESIREIGLLQPVVVRALGDERFELIAGERRCRAARMAGLVDVPAIVRDTTEPHTSLTEALIENLQREDLGPLEEAAAYRQLIDDFGLTHEEVADGVGRSRSTVSNTVRLLQLPGSVHLLLEQGRLSAGHARALLGLDDAAYATHIASRAADEGWSVRQVEDAVRIRTRFAGEQTTKPRKVRPPAILELEERLAERLGTRVDIDHAGRGGKMVIRYRSLDDLERIYRNLFG